MKTHTFTIKIFAKLALPLLALFVSSLAYSQHQSTLNVYVGDMFKSDATTTLGSGNVGLLVVDKGGDGFQGVNDSSTLFGSDFTLGSSFGGTDDEILSVTSSIFEDVEGFTFFNFSTGPINVDGTSVISSGDSIGFYFFDGLGSGETISAGQNFGFYRSNATDPISGSTTTWNIPDSGGLANLFANNYDYPLEVSALDLSTTLTVVPEPGTLMALALAVLAPVWLRMRRNARSRD